MQKIFEQNSDRGLLLGFLISDCKTTLAFLFKIVKTLRACKAYIDNKGMVNTKCLFTSQIRCRNNAKLVWQGHCVKYSYIGASGQ